MGRPGVWEGDYTAGAALVVNGTRTGAVVHDFGNGVTKNKIIRDTIQLLHNVEVGGPGRRLGQ